jgi:hypothetical protein
VRNESTDVHELFRVNTLGAVYQVDTTTEDDGEAIRITAKTKRINLNGLGLLKRLYLRFEAATDSVTVTVTAGGGEYGEATQSSTISLAGSEDTEAMVPLLRTLKGTWAEIQFTGSVSNRPAIRELVLFYVQIRPGRVSV